MIGIVTSPIDIDARNFIDAAGLAGSGTSGSVSYGTIRRALNELVRGMKREGIWSKTPIFYPLVGGTSTSHKFNLINPDDSNVAHRATFVGSPTHSANGVQGNGTSQYMRTYLNASTLSDSAGIAVYSRTQSSSSTSRHGVQLTGDQTFFFAIRINSTQMSMGRYTLPTNRSSTSSLGFHGIASNRILVRGSFVSPNLSAPSTKPNAEILLLARNGASAPSITAVGFESRQYAMLAVLDDYSSSNLESLYQLNEKFQTQLNRNV